MKDKKEDVMTCINSVIDKINESVKKEGESYAMTLMISYIFTLISCLHGVIEESKNIKLKKMVFEMLIDELHKIFWGDKKNDYTIH